MKSVKRIGSGLMAGILLISLLPVQALAAETACPHHPEHTAECGYAPAVEGAPCTHEHTDDCYESTTACILEDPSSPPPDDLEAPAEDNHVCSEETDCITKTLNCPHARGEHDETCGYAAPSAGAACGFVCDQCPQEGKADPQGEQPQEPSGETPVCTCTERCEAGAANAQCPVCADDPAACGVTDVQEPQEPTCGGMEGCADDKHNPACPLYVAPTCSNLEGCADDKHDPACPLYVAPTCGNLEGCADDKHDPACPLYVVPTCSNLEGCVDDKHDPNCSLYVAEEPAELADEGLTGPCGDNATYTLTPNDEAASTYTLTISGTGAMTDYAKAMLAPWHQYRAQITKVEFSEGLTTIGSRTCSSSAITTCRIPSTVRKIGDDAFSSTSNLANVEFAEQSQLEEIGRGAFWSTSSLRINLVLPDSLKKIGPLAFEKSGITGVTFGNSLEAIEASAFSVCANLTGEVYLPDSLKSLGNHAFNSSPITSVRIGPNIETWGGSVFSRGKGMPKISVKNGILVVKEGINNNTVVNSQYAGLDFQTIYVSSGKEMTFESYSFAHLSDVHTLVFLGDTLPTFESNAFLNTSPKIVYGINDNVSAWSGSSASIAITNGGTFAPSTTFEAGKLATPIKAGYGFGGWYASADFTGDAVTQPESGKTYYAKWESLSGSCGDSATYTLTPNGDATYTLTISGTGAMANYTKAGMQPWKNQLSAISNIVIESGITSVGDFAFIGAINATTVQLPEGLERIGQRGFANCHKLQSPVFPSTLKEIGENPFNECNAFDKIVLPDSLETTGNMLFRYCKSLSSINIPANMTALPEEFVIGCGNLTSIQIPATVTSIGKSAFAKTGLTEVTLPATLTTLGASLFVGCNSLEKVTINTSAKVESATFNDCSALNTIIFTADDFDLHVEPSNYLFGSVADKCAIILTGANPSSESITKIGKNIPANKNVVTLVPNGGVINGAAWTDSLTTPTKDGHVFLGWYETEDFTGAPVTQPVSGKTYYAKWRELKPSEIVLTVLKDGQSVTAATYGDTITLQAVVFEQKTRAAADTVDFFLGKEMLGTAEVKNGTAELSLTLNGEIWKSGKNTITAQYGGSDQLLDGSVTFELTVNKASQTAPVLGTNFTVDYAKELLSAEDSVEIWTAKDGGKQLTAPVSLTEHLGKTLYARFKETDTHLASDWTDVSIAQRPAAPTGVTGGRATLTGVKDTMEYSLDGKTFTEVPAGAGKVENLTAGIYQVRIAATATAPASSAVQVKVYDRTGSLTTTQTNGSVTTETTLRDDGTSTVVTTEKRPDGTVSALLENKDKNGKVTSSQQTITNPDGSKLVIQLPEDGSKVVTQYDKNGKVIQQTTYPDKNKPAYIITGFAPKIVEGNGRSFWGWSLSLRTDDALCNFQDVLVQGLSLNPSNYEVSEKDGTTQIILKRGYLAKLPAGTYKIGIVSTNGTAWGTFVIPAKGEGWNPGTGDYIFFTGATLLLSAAALTLLLLRKKRRQ